MKKYVLVTGASSGIGEEFAKQYASKGFNLVLVARSEEKLLKLSNLLIEQYNIQVHIIALDLSKEYSANHIFNYLEQEQIEIDIVVNNAGYATNGRLTNIDFQHQHEQIMLNSVTVMDLCYLFIKERLKNKKGGTIINIASTAAFHPIPYMSIYAATKAFVLSFTEALNKEYRQHGFDIIAVCPGATDTNFFSNGGVSFGIKRTPSDVVQTTFKGLKKQKISVIDGKQNIFSSVLLPKLLPRNQMANLVSNIMTKRIDKDGL
ncbi:SDR family NAD(P)-dependent oxidoreductase [Niallia sp. 01092]|uniref:SDR family NAD(P)-dependent oxidoreductase n=1 Tax=unclassified Niallia TaxID=2837522 RepID=UPI003FD55079